jgi:hypothetical protein
MTDHCADLLLVLGVAEVCNLTDIPRAEIA